MEIKRFIGGILEANGYVISDPETGECYIIDPGYRPKVFIQHVKKEGLKPLGILLTHHHSDHLIEQIHILPYPASDYEFFV